MSQKEWFEEYFNEDYAELILDSITPEFTSAQVRLIKDFLELKPSDKILDACCGKGRHAIALAREGYHITALDFVPAYTHYIDTISSQENLKIETLTTDIRKITFEQQFQKAYLMFTSFGYFKDSENEDLLNKLHQSIQKGGLLLIDIENRDYILKNFIYEKWRDKDFGLLLERHKFYPETSRQTTRRIQHRIDGTRKDSWRDLRLYSAHELLQIAKKANFELVKILGDYNGSNFQINSPRIIAALKAF